MTMRAWEIVLQGGAYDGWVGNTDDDPSEIVIAWRCTPQCEGHATLNPSDPWIVLRTAEAYRRVAMNAERRIAIYEVGEGPVGSPEVEERERVGVALSDAQPGDTVRVALG